MRVYDLIMVAEIMKNKCVSSIGIALSMFIEGGGVQSPSCSTDSSPLLHRRPLSQ